MKNEKSPTIVLSPEVLAKSFLIQEYREVLEGWRDGNYRLVVTRELLLCYLQLLRKLGLPDSQLRQWTAWFTATDKSRFFPQPKGSLTTLGTILQDAACRGEASCVVMADNSVEIGIDVPCRSVGEFISG